MQINIDRIGHKIKNLRPLWLPRSTMFTRIKRHNATN